MLANGRGAPQDTQAALQWCEKAASQKFAGGFFCVGYLEESGVLGSPDYKQAAEWYRKAAEREYPLAMFLLGKMYAEGRGVRQDNIAAYMWLWLAKASRVQGAAGELDALSGRIAKGEAEKGTKKALEWINKKGSLALQQRSAPPTRP